MKIGPYNIYCNLKLNISILIRKFFLEILINFYFYKDQKDNNKDQKS